MSQRQFALEMRAAIDNFWKSASPQRLDNIVALAESHPNAVRSSHVVHNLGEERMAWLKRMEIV
jgi:hypothetical protein